MGCPWLPYCMLLLSPQINREHKFHPGPGPADTLPSPVRFLKISRKEDGMRWSRSCWYNQKKLYPGEILEFLYLCGIVLYPLYFSFYGFFHATDSEGWSEWHNAIQCDEVAGWHQHSSQSSLAISIPRHITPGSKQTFTLGPELVCEEILFGKQEQFP